MFLHEGKAFPGDTRQRSLTQRDASVLQCPLANHVWPWVRGSLGSGSNRMFPGIRGWLGLQSPVDGIPQAIRGPKRKPRRILPWVGVGV